MGRIVGIDLGTSTSEVAVLQDGQPYLIRDVSGSRHGVLPSIVGVGRSGELLLGHDVEARAVARAGFAVAEVKREMGRTAPIAMGGVMHSPQEVSAMILRHLKLAAERFLGEEVTDAVITVPARFNELQRRATLDAGELAGLTVRRLINEPTAAAIAYGLDRPHAEERILVYDLGGGTLDVTLLELSEGILDVLCSVGNDRLGGTDLDQRVMTWIAAEAERLRGVDLMATAEGRLLLKEVARRAKEDLSALPATTVRLALAATGRPGDSAELELQLSRPMFELLVEDLVLASRAAIDEALRLREIRPEQVQRVLLVGGSTRVPLVRRIVGERFGGRVVEGAVDPAEAVALGAAVVAGMMDRQVEPGRMVVTDVSSWTLGVAVTYCGPGYYVDNAFDPLIRRNETIPRTVRRTYQTLHDGQTEVLIRVYQGEQPTATDNVFVGQVRHDNLTPGSAGQDLEVEFSYDLSGVLRVRVKDEPSGREVEGFMEPATEQMSPDEKRAARARLELRWSGIPGEPAPGA